MKTNKSPNKSVALHATLISITVIAIITAGIVITLERFPVPLERENAAAPAVTPSVDKPVSSDTAPAEKQPISSEPETVKEKTVKLVSVGDNLIHEGIYKQAAKRAADSMSYDFSFIYRNVKKRIADADIATINQETLMSSLHEPSAYPMFNSPQELGIEMVKTGFDVITTANNHMLDKQEKGLISTIDFWKSQPVLMIGAYYNEEDASNIRLTEVNGIRFAFVGLTEYTNGLTLPKESDLVYRLLSEQELLRADIEKAKASADIVVVNAHWGIEYTHIPNSTQKAMAKRMADWGADIIIGHHPHVIQPVEWIECSDGRRTIVAYSLGNFISAQKYGPRMLGGMLEVEVRKDNESGKADIQDVVFSPVVTHYGKNFSDIENYFLSDYSKELADSHGCRNESPEFSIDYLEKTVKELISSEFLNDGDIISNSDAA